MFEKNLAELEAAGADCVSAIRAATIDPGIEFISGHCGAPSAILRPSEGHPGRALYSRYDPQKQAERDATLFAESSGGADTIIVLGLGLGYHLQNLAEMFPNTNFVIFEKRPAFARAALERADFRDVIRAGRLALHVGKSVETAVIAAREAAAARNCSATAVFRHPAVFMTEMDYYFPLLRAVKNACRTRGLRVLSFLARGSALPYSLADCHDAFRALGHEVRVVDIRETVRERQKVEAAFEAAVDFAPDMVFTIDVAGLVPELHGHMGVPVVSWFFDNPLSFLEGGSTGREAAVHYIEDMGDNYYIYSWDQSYIDELRARGARHVEHLPFAANPEVFMPLELTAEQRELYGCDVSFAGNSGVAGDNMYRRRAVQKLAGLNVKVFGDTGWETVAGGGIEYRGHADNRTALPLLYNASAINLNLTDAQLRTALPIRVFDVIAAGGFLISDYRIDLIDLFQEGKEVVCCRDMDALREVVDHYLARPDERRAIADAGRRRILAEHTFKHRIARIVEKVMARNAAHGANAED